MQEDQTDLQAVVVHQEDWLIGTQLLNKAGW